MWAYQQVVMCTDDVVIYWIYIYIYVGYTWIKTMLSLNIRMVIGYIFMKMQKNKPLMSLQVYSINLKMMHECPSADDSLPLLHDHDVWQRQLLRDCNQWACKWAQSIPDSAHDTSLASVSWFGTLCSSSQKMPPVEMPFPLACQVCEREMPGTIKQSPSSLNMSRKTLADLGSCKWQLLIDMSRRKALSLLIGHVYSNKQINLSVAITCCYNHQGHMMSYEQFCY